MAKECEVLGKVGQRGDSHLHRHSAWRFRAQRTKRDWQINSKVVKVIDDDGQSYWIRMSMKAYKRYRQDGLAFLRKHKVL